MAIQQPATSHSQTTTTEPSTSAVDSITATPIINTSDAVHTKPTTPTKLTTPTKPTPPSSPNRKRQRDEDEPARLSRQRIPDGQSSSCSRISQNVTPVNFLGHMLPTAVVEHIISFLPRDDILTITMHILVPYLQKEMSEKDDRFHNFLNVPATGPLTRVQKTMMQNLIANRENNKDEDECIVIPQTTGGKPKRFLRIPKVQKNSKDSVKRTRNQRSQYVEKVEKAIAMSDGLHSQRVNNISRDKVGYAAAAEEAGLKVVTRFSRETVLSLRAIMTLKMWRTLKRVFTAEVGWDVFGSVGELEKDLKKMEFAYDCGTVTSSTGEVLHFVRVDSIKEVVTQLVNELRKAGEIVELDNLKSDHLWLHAACDKGGKSTKLILQVINQRSRHSMDLTKLIGYYEGKDNRVNLEAVFGPLLKELQECCVNISLLELERPSIPPTSHRHSALVNPDENSK